MTAAADKEEDAQISPDAIAQLQDQDEEITVTWPSVVESSKNCYTELVTSIRYMGVEEFGQEEDIKGG